jgi:hypothetical protein
MSKKIICILLAVIFFLPDLIQAQSPVLIPAFTAYAVPAEPSNEDGESSMFSTQKGLQNWIDTRQTIRFYFDIRNKGKLNLALFLKNDVPGNMIALTIAGKNFTIAVPASKQFTRKVIGTIEISDTGFYMLSLSSVIKKGKNIADIQSLELSGEAVKNMHFNAKARRNTASVHLLYPLSDSMKVISFYNEITVPENADPLYSYYMACGFARGYLGIQVNSASERRVIFSVWDAGNEATDRNKVAAENKVQLMAKGEDVVADGFGNEGTGGHSHWAYNWKAGVTYKFLVTAAMDSATATTSYAGYFFIPETQKWKLIACFKAPKDGKPLQHLYSFVENFDGSNGQLLRKAFFSNQWIRRESGEWKEITKSSFSYDATGKAGDRIDYGGGVDRNQFYLWNGEFKKADARFGDIFNRDTISHKPLIDLYKNADSAIEIAKENQLILQAIRLGKLDTSGSSNGVYYKILKEGSGDFISVTDTLVVNYIGSLLDGSVFDQTKEKPATFPLKRLIRGWQLGLPLCRQGGKIHLIIPSYLGYSIRNLGVIPPNSPLIFDIEVLELKKGVK